MLIVVAGVAQRAGRVMVCRRRAEASNGLKWEFPGGKIEPGESPEEALRREIREELDTVVDVGERLCDVEWDYPEFHLSMGCYLCTVVSGELTLREHESARWLDDAHLEDVNWLPADRTVIEEIKKLPG